MEVSRQQRRGSFFEPLDPICTIRLFDLLQTQPDGLTGRALIHWIGEPGKRDNQTRTIVYISD